MAFQWAVKGKLSSLKPEPMISTAGGLYTPNYSCFYRAINQGASENNCHLYSPHRRQLECIGVSERVPSVYYISICRETLKIVYVPEMYRNVLNPAKKMLSQRPSCILHFSSTSWITPGICVLILIFQCELNYWSQRKNQALCNCLVQCIYLLLQLFVVFFTGIG